MDDYRIDPPRRSMSENIDYARGILGEQLINIKGLWPTLDDYREVPRTWKADLIAGITVGIVALPLALGFGVASGMGAAAGLITAIIAGIVAAVFGGSHLQVSGPTGAMTVVLLPVIATHGVDKVPLLAVMAGVIVVAMGMTGLGKIVDLIPFPVVEGFTFGIGIIIALQQLPLVTGGPKGSSESSLVAAWQSLIGTDWRAASVPLLVMTIVIAVHLIGRRLSKSLPVALIAIVIATVVAHAAHLDVARIGELPSTLPAPSFPEVDWGLLQSLIGPACAIAGLAALESLLSARVADGMVPTVPNTNSDRELVGQGLANMASGFFGGLPATGAIARTAVNCKSGGQTRLSIIVHSLILLGVMLVAGPVVAYIPMAALGGVLIMVAIGMLNVGKAKRIMTVTRADRNTFLLTLACTVLLDLVMAVLLGFAMAALMSLRHMANYSVIAPQVLPASTPDGLVDLPEKHENLRESIRIFRIDGALFYGSSGRFIAELKKVDSDTKVVIIRFHRMHVFDASGGEALRTAVFNLHRRGIRVIAQGMIPDQLHTAELLAGIGAREHREDLKDALALAIEIQSAGDDADASGGVIPA